MGLDGAESGSSLGGVAGYAASVRLQGTAPRFVGRSLGVPVTDADLMAGEPGQPDRIELEGRSLDERISERLASASETWSQATFFLFDPNSWR